jgi:peptidyl-prolyl cis-trans isomerase NIMA-interacting 1
MVMTPLTRVFRWFACACLPLSLAACSLERAPSSENTTTVSAVGPTLLEPKPPLTEAGPVKWRRPAIEQPTTARRPPASSPPSAPVIPYPPARWRLAHGAELSRVVLWVDHILIRHRDVRNQVSFSRTDWYAAQPEVERSRDEALDLARTLASEAARRPETFGELARRHSEDIISREEGGALGGITASSLADWPQVLDALAALHAGQTSEVVETRYGFHVLRRGEPPPEETSSGVHVVIGHDEAEWLKLHARGRLPSRTRAEALSLARQIQREAASHPQRFPELVERYSEHRDAIAGGDIGDWSSREPCSYPARLQRLAQLEIGSVGAPIETNLGVEVLLRRAPRARAHYAARVTALRYDPKAPDGAEASRGRVAERAEALARTFAATAEGLGVPAGTPDAGAVALPGQRAPAETPRWERIQWQDGRGVPTLTAALKGLALGEVTPVPVPAAFSFQIAQRVAPRPEPPARYTTELPAPSIPDLDYHAGRMKPDALEAAFRSAENHLTASGHSATVARLKPLPERARVLDPNGRPHARRAALQDLLERARALLSPRDYEAYLASLHLGVGSVLMSATRHPRLALGL